MGMPLYRRLPHPNKVTILQKSAMAIQVDGESWIESKGILQISLLHQVYAVVGKKEPNGVRIV